jgi:hypothetical protein
MRSALACLTCLLVPLLCGCSCSDTPASPELGLLDGGGGEGLLFPDQQTVPADHSASPDDWDGDGLKNEDEVRLGTDPWKRDTDGDGKSDLEEVKDPASPADSDGDKLIDALEPSNFDSDNDKTPDDQDPDPGLCNGVPRLFVNVVRSESLALTKACSPYRVMSQLQMRGQALLSAEPGVQVQFGPGAALIIGDNTTTGGLELLGAVEDRISLTSTAQVPKKGDWRGIVVERAKSLTLAHLNLEWAGTEDPSGDPRAALLVKTAQTISLTGVSFSHVAGTGLHADFYSDPGPLFPAFTGCKMSDLDGAAAVLHIRHLGEIGAGNDFAGAGPGAVIRVTKDLVLKDAVWKAVGVPYQLVEETLNVEANLTLQAGVKVLMPANTVVLVGASPAGTGSLTAKGTVDAAVTLQTASPAPGSWQGLVLQGGKNALSYTVIRGAGHIASTGKSATIYLGQTATLSPDHVTISESDGFGALYYRSGVFGCLTASGNGYTFQGSFPGDSAHPGCKFLCIDDAQQKCVVGP